MMKTTLVGIIKVRTHRMPVCGSGAVLPVYVARVEELSFRLIQNNFWKMVSERNLCVKLLERYIKGLFLIQK
jgi:hypothetical protein